MKNTVVVVAESCELREQLETYFLHNSEFALAGMAENGISGVDVILQKQPTIAIIDLILSGIDGLEVAERVRNEKIKTKIVLLSPFAEESMVKNAISKGVCYYIVKPFNIAILDQRLKEVLSINCEEKIMAERKKLLALEEKISNIFITVGIPPHIKGYSYLREGVKMAIRNPSVINNITKQLYPMVGERYQTSASKVERAIRHAIEVAWNRGKIENINSIFGVRAYVGSEKPTNGEFIALIADKLMLEWA